MSGIALKDFAAYQEMARKLAAEMHKAPERKKREEFAAKVGKKLGFVVLK
jgi:hypothetical protein